MAALLKKFRIDYSNLVVIPDLTKDPKPSTQTWFNGVIGHFSRREGYGM